MTLPFDNATSRVVKKLAIRSLMAEKRRNLFICCTITLAVSLMAGLSFFAIAQKKKVEAGIRGQYQVMVVPAVQERIDSLTAQPEVERWGISKNYAISRYQDSVLRVLYADANWMKLGNKPAVEGQMPQGAREILVESAFLDYFHLPQKTGQTITLDLGDGEQVYTITGILPVENFSRMFEIIVSKAYVTACAKGVPEYEFRMCYRGGEQMDASQLKTAILTFLTEHNIPEQEIIFSSSYFNQETFHSNVGSYAIPAALLVLIACGIVIYNIFYLSIKGKVKEYGRLKVLGTTPKQLSRIVRCESVYLSVIGIPAGFLIGGAAAYVGLPSYWNWMDNLKASVIILVVTELMIFLSTYTPVRMAAKASPMEAVRICVYAAEAGRAKLHQIPRRLTPYTLARMNFERSGKKAAITLASLSLSGILLLAVATLFQSVNYDSMAAIIMGDGCNYMISWQDSVDMEEVPKQAQNNPLTDELRAQIAALPEVEAITGYDAATVEIAMPRKTNSYLILALTREQFKQQLLDRRMAAGTADYDALIAGNGILVSDTNDHIFSRQGYTPKIGDVLPVKTYGGQDRDLTVMGIVEEDSGDATGVLLPLFILPRETLHKLYPKIDNFQMVWNVHTTQDSSILRKQLFQIAKDPALTIISRSDLKATVQTNMQQVMMQLYFFMAFLFLFALVNLSNTLMTNLTARRQELGILQSVGMTQKQLSTMLALECLWYIVGALGLSIAIGGGCGAVLVLLMNHFKILGVLDYCFPFIELAVFVLALGIIQCFYVYLAARYRKRQSLVERIKAAD